jgi:benzoyl-CoA reductase/2-hydroxyglutaryl-CoA dehydratase subunit BcrC/BadD/HgdB
MEHRNKRTKQLQDFLIFSQQHKEKSTMKDMSEKASGLLQKPVSEMSASQKRSRAITDLFMKAYDPNSCVVWHSLFMPTEIFRAMDIIPFTSEMVAAGIAGAGISRVLVERGESYTQCMDSCSFATCSAGAMLEDLFPSPDFIVTTSQLCDTAIKLARLSAQLTGRKEFFIDVPYGTAAMQPDAWNDAVDYVARQLQSMVAFIERETDRKLDEQKLYETLKRSNEAREWFLKAMELRQQPYPLIRGTQILDYSVNLLNIWGSEESVDVFRSLYEELKAALERGGAFSGKYRLVWYHLRPYYDNTIINYLEKECGAYLIHEIANWIFWEAFDPEDPYRSVARKILANPAYSPLDVQLNIIKKHSHEWKPDAFIGFTHKGCRHLYSAIHMAEENMKHLIPWLVIDGDCIDPRAYSFPLIKTRIDSFFDMLELKKTRREGSTLQQSAL